MCELLGMSANVPTDICFSFTGLMQRGGNTGPHSDGWGIAFYQDGGYREFKDPQPSYQSEIAKLIKSYPIKSDIVISHIRQANSGRISLANTHPYTREMWGRNWCYAHNGQLKNFSPHLRRSHYTPIGQTDSEQAYCWLLNKIRHRFPTPPSYKPELWEYIGELATELAGFGVFNLLLSDSNYLYCYCSTKLAWITRKAPFGEANLKDEDLTVNFSEETTPNDIVSVVSTEPLTDNETWSKMEPGELLVLQQGEVVFNKRYQITSNQ